MTNRVQETWGKNGALLRVRQTAMETCAPRLIKNRVFLHENSSNTKILLMKSGAGQLGTRKVILSQRGLMDNSKMNCVHNF